MIKQPNVFVFDIETSPMLAYVFGLKDQNIGLNQVVKDWEILAWSGKWLNSDVVVYQDKRHDKNDKRILKVLWKFLDKADIVITQYGSGFDSPRVNARFILHGMKPPSPYKHLDTYRIVKRVADFTSNKLEYLTDKLCVKYKKLSHSKYPGMSLWTECLSGNIDAWNEMKKYNIHDVLSTEELYNNIKAWAPQTMPLPVISSDPERQCSVCGLYTLEHRGIDRTKTRSYQRLHCKRCGTWSRGKIIK